MVAPPVTKSDSSPEGKKVLIWNQKRERTALLSLHVPLEEASLAHAIGVERVGQKNADAQQHAQSRDCFGHRLTPWFAMIALRGRANMIEPRWLEFGRLSALCFRMASLA